MTGAEHKVFCTGPDESPVSIVAALALFNNWSIEIPPADATGDVVTDRLLTADFNTLAGLHTRAARFQWIEEQLSTNRDLNSDFPSPNAPKNLRNAILIKWWLDLYNHAQEAPPA